MSIWTEPVHLSQRTAVSFLKPPLRNRGFTLLEVMIAIAILAITLATLYGSQAQSLSLAEEAQFNIQAAALARGKLAEYESGIIPLESDEGDFGEDFPGYSWVAEVQDANFADIAFLSGLESSLRMIDLTVSRGDERLRMSLRCYVQKEGTP